MRGLKHVNQPNNEVIAVESHSSLSAWIETYEKVTQPVRDGSHSSLSAWIETSCSAK